MSPHGAPHRVVLVPGDGIGPEVTQAARRALDATGVALDRVEAPAGERALRECGAVVPDDTLAVAREVVILSGVLMLRHLGELDAADRLRAAVRSVLAAGQHTTRDIGGCAGTREMTEAVIRALG